jgi:hypothetical protein
MALSAPLLHHTARSDEALTGPALPVLCGLAWLGTALGFSFLDRARGEFAPFALAWLLIGLLGFGLAVVFREQPQRVQRTARLLTVLACVLALVPGLLMFSLVRWGGFALLLVTAARAAAMHTHRDVYYALAAIVSVSLLVVVHGNADWTVWFYLAPAWLCVVLALAWDYAAQVRLAAPLKAALSLAFVAVCIAAGGVLAALLPLPPTPGFGVFDPPTANPQHTGRASPGGSGGGATGTAAGSGTVTGGASSLAAVIGALRRGLADKGVPQWQRSVIGGMLAAAEALERASGSGVVVLRPMTAQELQEARDRAAALRAALDAALLLLALLLSLLLLWLVRWRIVGAGAFAAAALLAPWAPGRSMRCSMVALHCLLHRRGYPRAPGQSLLEHVASARSLQPRLRQWLRHAVHTYGNWRFGAASPSPAQAREVRRAVLAADELLRMKVPP